DRAEPLAALWRTKQLEYTWLRSLMGEYEDFHRLTLDALGYSLAALKISGDGLADKLIGLYQRLDPYPEVVDVLTRLNEAGLRCAILSNGSPEMLDSAVESAGLGELLDQVISVDEIAVYKPHPSVYRLAAERLGLAASDICFMSSNAWDVAGAANFGFRVVWINRFGQPPEPLPGKPAGEITTLGELPQLLGVKSV
ncbi:MAG: haloacid dehalogenase type II, partial [Rhodospirillales bacterium]